VIEIAFAQRERFLDAQSRSPHDHDQSAKAPTVPIVSRGAHNGDDLLHLGRVGRVAQTLISGRVAGAEFRHRRRRPTSPGMVEQKLGHDPSSGSWNAPDYQPTRRAADPSPTDRCYRFRHRAAVKVDPRRVSRLPLRDSPGRIR
jgi:hypothetical protein